VNNQTQVKDSVVQQAFCYYYAFNYYDTIEEAYDSADLILEGLEPTPLYTHPAQPWQGLTESEITKIVNDDKFWQGGCEPTVIARAIEQALKEKNK